MAVVAWRAMWSAALTGESRRICLIAAVALATISASAEPPQGSSVVSQYLSLTNFCQD